MKTEAEIRAKRNARTEKDAQKDASTWAWRQALDWVLDENDFKPIKEKKLRN